MSKPTKPFAMMLNPDEARLMSQLCAEWLERGAFVPGGPDEYVAERVRAKCERLAKARRDA